MSIQKYLKHFLWYWLPALLWAGLIFWFSHQPTLPGPQDYWVNFAVKKPLHALEYAILALLLFRAHSGGNFAKSDFANSRSRTSFIFAVLVATLYAASDEIHQIFIPGREATVRDFLFDVVGIFSFALFVVRKTRKH